MIKHNSQLQGKNEIEWRRFLALISIGVSHNKDPIQAMKIVSESFSDQSKGEGCSMNTEDFINMFKHVAIIKKIDEGNLLKGIDNKTEFQFFHICSLLSYNLRKQNGSKLQKINKVGYKFLNCKFLKFPMDQNEGNPLVHLYLIFEKSSWKNQVRQTGFLLPV